MAVIEIMKAAAQASGCDYSPYNQMAPIAAGALPANDGGGGICFGLAVTWLEMKLKEALTDRESRSRKEWVQRANSHQTSVFAESHLYWREQNGDLWKERTGLRPATKADGSGQVTFDMADGGCLPFCKHIGSTLKQGYYLVEIPGHAMAACGNKLGRVQFFDPNAGIVGTFFASKLEKCLSAYFADAFIKTNYKTSPQNHVILTVKTLVHD